MDDSRSMAWMRWAVGDWGAWEDFGEAAENMMVSTSFALLITARASEGEWTSVRLWFRTESLPTGSVEMSWAFEPRERIESGFFFGSHMRAVTSHGRGSSGGES